MLHCHAKYCSNVLALEETDGSGNKCIWIGIYGNEASNRVPTWIRYKLRMFGIPVDEPAFIYGDNQSVLINASVTESTLKKKRQSVAYHFVREGCAADEWRTTFIHTSLNVSDLITKPLSGEKRWCFVRILLHHIYCGNKVSIGMMTRMEYVMGALYHHLGYYMIVGQVHVKVFFFTLQSRTWEVLD